MDEACANISNNTTTNENRRVGSDKIFLKQLVVVSGAWAVYFMGGLSTGAPTVLIPQIRRDPNFNATIDEDMASWLASAHIYSGAMGVVVLCALARSVGRKPTFIIVSLSSLAGYLLFYCSGSVMRILMSEIALGPVFGCQSSLSILVLTEYTSPQYRGAFLATKVAVYFWGVWVANAVGTFFHWRKIPLIGVVCSLYATVSVAFWPESPYWLARRARYNECLVSHRWLKGDGADAEKELGDLIARRGDSHENIEDETVDRRVERKDNLFRPIALALLLVTLYSVSGKLVCSVYAVEIIGKVTSDEGAAYAGMLALDGVTVLSMYVAGGLARVLRRRTLLLTSASVAILLLYAISLYLYLTRAGLLADSEYVTLLLLSMFSVSVSCGPINMCLSVYGELMPLRRRSASTLLVGVVGCAISATTVKLGPLLFAALELHGAFLFYAVASSLCTLLLYAYLPETKDRTLREIQDCFNGKPMDEKRETAELIRMY